MTYTEEALLFPCAGDTLLGILARPVLPFDIGVVVVVGGPQYRAGSHRQFVLLSRTLAAAGYAVLRFDYRGMGDSEGTPRDFLTVSPDIACAIDALQKHLPAVQRVALWGLCDGASAALLYCADTHDPRVRSLYLLNPWVRSSASLARTQVKHYYLQRLLQKSFWFKFLRGGVAWPAARSLVHNLAQAFTGHRGTGTPASAHTFQQRMAQAWVAFNGPVFLLLSSDDYTAKEFLEYANTHADWKPVLASAHTVRHDLQGADHTFSSAASSARVAMLTLAGLP